MTLRHKSEIEHHRNKIRLRAKRKGHYDFPTMNDPADGVADPKEQDRIYQKAQQQIDKILDPDTHMPQPFTEPKKRSGLRECGLSLFLMDWGPSSLARSVCFSLSSVFAVLIQIEMPFWPNMF